MDHLESRLCIVGERFTIIVLKGLALSERLLSIMVLWLGLTCDIKSLNCSRLMMMGEGKVDYCGVNVGIWISFSSMIYRHAFLYFSICMLMFLCMYMCMCIYARVDTCLFDFYGYIFTNCVCIMCRVYTKLKKLRSVKQGIRHLNALDIQVNDFGLG